MATTEATAKATFVIVIFGVVFGCSIKIRLASSEGTVIIFLRKKMMIIAFEIIIDDVFGIGIAVVVVIVIVVNCGIQILNPIIRIIIDGVIDKAKGPIITERRIMVVVVKIITDVVFGIEIAVVAVVVVNGEDHTLLCVTLSPAVGTIIVGVDKAKGPVICGVRDLDIVGTVIVI